MPNISTKIFHYFDLLFLYRDIYIKNSYLYKKLINFFILTNFAPMEYIKLSCDFYINIYLSLPSTTINNFARINLATAQIAREYKSQITEKFTIESIYENGIEYTVFGKLHRENDLPAVITKNGTRYWYQFGIHHRENGPAITYNSGRELWIHNNKIISDENYLKKIKKIKQK
jgi:hypothetical protein